MRNLLQFLLKYSHVILFLVLEAIAFTLIVTENDYQRSVSFTSATAVAGNIYAVTDEIGQYFSLKRENGELAEENARLMEEIASLRNRLEVVEERDSAYLYSHLGLHFIPARVVQTESGKRHNCFTLNKGTRDGVETDMGVVGQEGAVGLVTAVSERFALVMPLVNEQMMLSCRLTGSSVYGPLEWDGTDVRYATLSNIARHAEVSVGDTVITSGLTTAFPEGVPVGVVDETELKETDAYYHIRVRLLTDFRKPRYVQVISNDALREQSEMEDY